MALFLFVMAFLTGCGDDADPLSLSVNPESKDSVTQLYKTVYLPDQTLDPGWTGSVAACNPGTITLSIRKKDDVLLDIDQALPCGLVLNELIANAVKHAFPGGRKGEITVEIDRSQDDDIEIVMADNGAGLPAAVDPLRSRTVGLHLIRGLVKHQLHGRLEVRSGPGTTYRICFRPRSDRRKG